MKEIIFRCDQCKKALSGSGSATQHISLGLQREQCGLATPPKDLLAPQERDWQLIKFGKLGNIAQFCNVDCLTSYFTTRVGEINMKQLKQ